MTHIEATPLEVIKILTGLNFIIKHGKFKVVKNVSVSQLAMAIDKKLDDIEFINKCCGVELKIPLTLAEVRSIADMFRANNVGDFI